MENKLVSVVIPAHNEEDNIIVIIKRIEKVFSELHYNYEILLVDDGCTDNTLSIIKDLSSRDPRLFYVEFSRNFGHQPALKAGLDLSHGDCVISLDADLQHPPELFKQMLEKWEEGYEVVYTRRKEDKNLSFKKRKSSQYFYKLLNSLSDIELESGTADFRLLDRVAVEAFRNFNEADPFIRGLVKLLGFKQFAIDYVPDKRFSGASKYSISKMRRLAIQGVTSLSIKPLHTAVYLGFTFSMISLLYLPYVFYAFYKGQEVNGWASLIMTISFFGGLQLVILGIIGIYVGKMFIQTKNRPNYIIRSTNLKNI
ncbi:glycosyltransferase family 2 protein [Pedobacter polaris]|uniref:Glycosyltransferase family 2 protein n=1 Tax=Pedobacter polaris TaxID=2571273 RepID=A0A4U1CT18_9SPHI|nr:glycosyltransferase family 2 protein [Pedobacter polaris]TKC10185.1 glycosyltransferase family 2 protein [Pedobacter polaris]